MLKKIFVLVAFAIVGSSAFADYKGDLQLRGLGFGNATFGNGDLSNIRFFIGGTFNFGRK